MATVTVSTTAQLLSALAAANSGDTILLASGSYSGVKISGFDFAESVTIASADPSNPAKLLDLNVLYSSGLAFNHVEMDASAQTSFVVYGCDNVEFNNIHFHGTLDGDPSDDTAWFAIRSCTNVKVTDSEFEQATNAMAISYSQHVTVEGTSFHDLRSDGIQVAGSSWVTLTGNTFTDFYPLSGDHPDAIQFWTTNTTEPAHDIIITDNLITRGDGGLIQGIFLRDQVGTLPYGNVTVAGNMIVGSSWNGILIMGANDVHVSDNILASGVDEVSRIRLENVDGAVLSNNQAGAFLLTVNDTNISSTGDVVIMPSPEQTQQLLETWEAQLSRTDTSGTTTDASGTTTDTSGTTTDTSGTTTDTSGTTTDTSGTTTDTTTSSGDPTGSTPKGKGHTSAHGGGPKKGAFSTDATSVQTSEITNSNTSTDSLTDPASGGARGGGKSFHKEGVSNTLASDNSLSHDFSLSADSIQSELLLYTLHGGHSGISEHSLW